MRQFINPYSVWSNNLRMRVHVQSRYPFAGLTVSAFKFGLFLNPRFGSRVASTASTRKLLTSYYLKSVGTEIILSADSIVQLLNDFWTEVYSRDEDRFVLVQLRIKSTDSFYSVSKFQTVLFRDKDKLAQVFVTRLELIYERYTQFPIQELFLRYTFLPEDSPVARTSLSSEIIDFSHLNTLSAINLPATLDLNKWGKVNKINDSLTLIDSGRYLFTVQIDGNNRKITAVTKASVETNLSFTDTIISLCDDEFIRTMEDSKIITYKNGSQISLVHRQRDVVYVNAVPKVKAAKFNAITLDLETQRMPDNDLRVISAVFYDGHIYNTYFINDFTSSADLIAVMLSDLFQPRNSGKIVYIHNLSGFDGMFLLKALANVAETFDIVRKDDKIISLTVSRGAKKDKVRLIFKDSLLLLPSSLQKLGKAFAVEMKGEFSHLETLSASWRDSLHKNEGVGKAAPIFGYLGISIGILAFIVWSHLKEYIRFLTRNP